MLRFHHANAGLRLPGRALIVALGTAAFLAGCGFRPFEPREQWRGEAEAACMRSGIVKTSSVIRPTKPIDGPGPCGADMPLKVSGFENDPNTVAVALASTGTSTSGFSTGILQLTVLKPEATLGCPMVAWTDDWVAGSVQPAAIAWFGQGIKEIRTAGSYACRRRNHRPGARLSEHAFGNAIDVMSFMLNDGNIVTVKGGWRGTEQEQGFLRDVFHGACQRFKTVLGPGSDALHYDHFHLDLAHHDARGTRRYCKPQVAAPQRPMPGTFGPGVNPWGGPPNPYAFNQRSPANDQPNYGTMPPAGIASGAILPRPQASAALSRSAPPISEESRRNDPHGGEFSGNEVEPDFDPSEFDLTGSVAELPTRRDRPAFDQPIPPKPIPTRRPQLQRATGYNPAGN